MGRFAKNRELKDQGYAIRVPVGSSAVRTGSPTTGLVRYNTDTARFEFYYNSNWYNIAKEGSSTIVKDSQGYGSNLGAADGVINTFTMSYSYTAGQEAQVIVFVGSVYQNPGVAYTFNGTTTITFTAAPPLGQTIVILHNFASTITT
jgi:hypothetical protein